MDQIKAQGSSKGGGCADSVGDSVASAIHRAEEVVSAGASDATGAGSDALKALQTDLSDLKETVVKLMSRASDETARQVSPAASDIADRGANVASVAADQAKTFATELENIAHRNPLGALAGAVVVGVLIGMMGRRS
jgi:ElaB/YqjD/DUF883 family membrane-anchored ribosome-binding protein